jgi:acyl-CoA synthetase (AMP-forming)/AMP-acid ligase II
MSPRPAGPYLRTGDLGFVAAGEVFPTGRWADLVVIDGHNYYPNDIEATVADCHRVLVAGRGAVFTVTPIAGALEQLVVVHEVDPEYAGVDLGGVIAAIRAAIRAHHAVAATAVLLVAPLSLPTTSSGKIRRGASRQQFLDGDLAVVAQWGAADDLSLEDLEAATKMVSALQARAARQR